jgi:hypothetical protein
MASEPHVEHILAIERRRRTFGDEDVCVVALGHTGESVKDGGVAADVDVSGIRVASLLVKQLSCRRPVRVFTERITRVLDGRLGLSHVDERTIENVGVASVEEATHKPVEQVSLTENASDPRVVIGPVTCSRQVGTITAVNEHKRNFIACGLNSGCSLAWSKR